MGEVVPISGTPERKPPTAGQALFTAIVDTLDAEGVRLPRTLIATAAKQGAAALEDGIDPETVLAGCLLALRQGKCRYTTHIIGDVVLARSGLYVTTHEARSIIVNERQRNNAPLQKLLDVWRQEREADRRPKLERGTL